MNFKERYLVKNWKIIKQKYIYIILCFFSFMIMSLCFQDTINYDEFFSMYWCRWKWQELLQRLVNDVHPPLYYLLLKCLLDITNGSMFCARLLSAVFGILILWTGSLFILRNFGKKEALFYVCFIYLNPFMIQKTTEIRMYMIASLFTIISGEMTYYILKGAKKRHWIIFYVSSLMAAYTHYYALLTMCFLYAGIILYFIVTRNKTNIRAWIICAIATVVGYMPWLPIAIKQITNVNGSYWITMPSSRLAPLRELFYSRLPYTEHIYLLIIVLLSFIAFVTFLKNRSVGSYWTLICNSAVWGIMIFAILYAKHIRPILVSRYLIMAVCLSILGISNMIRFLNKNIVIVICVFCGIVGGMRYETALLAQSNRNTTYTVEFVEQNVDELDRIVYVSDNYGYYANCLKYYFQEIDCISIENFQVEKMEQLAAETAGNVWFFDFNKDISEKIALNAEEKGEYGFNSNTFKIYKIRK